MSPRNDIAGSPWLALVENATDGYVVVARNPWRLVYANATIANWIGSTPEALRDLPIGDVFGGDIARELTEQLEDVWNEDVPNANFALANAPWAGRRLSVRLQRVPLGNTTAVAMLVCDREVRNSSGLTEAGRRDPLTGLPDRAVLLARMSTLLGGERAADRRFAVLFIDLDNFKQVNDAHGHLVGDRALGEVARRLADSVRAGDTIVRFGGDEFVALIERTSGWPEIEPVVDRIHAALAEPIVLPDGDVTLSVSIGLAEASAAHRTPEDLLQEADRAMYASKRAPT